MRGAITALPLHTAMHLTLSPAPCTTHPTLTLFALLVHDRLSRTERKILKLLRQGSAVLLMGRSGTGASLGGLRQ